MSFVTSVEGAKSVELQERIRYALGETHRVSFTNSSTCREPLNISLTILLERENSWDVRDLISKSLSEDLNRLTLIHLSHVCISRTVEKRDPARFQLEQGLSTQPDLEDPDRTAEEIGRQHQYPEGGYIGKVVQQALVKSKNKGTPQLVIRFTVESKADGGDSGPRRERTMYRVITANTTQYVQEDLAKLGFTGTSISEVDPNSPKFSFDLCCRR